VGTGRVRTQKRHLFLDPATPAKVSNQTVNVTPLPVLGPYGFPPMFPPGLTTGLQDILLLSTGQITSLSANTRVQMAFFSGMQRLQFIILCLMLIGVATAAFDEQHAGTTGAVPPSTSARAIPAGPTQKELEDLKQALAEALKEKEDLKKKLDEANKPPEDLDVAFLRPWRAEDVHQRRQGVGTDMSMADMDPNGAYECRCLPSLPPDVAPLYRARGFPANYGVGSCMAHDKNLANTSAQAEVGCVPGPNQANYCGFEWCYVDPDTCGIDKLGCEELGFKVGSYDSILCRARDKTRESYAWLEDKGKNASNVYFSYQTCGNLDFYTREVDEKRTVQSTIAGRVFTAVIPSDALAPWVYPPGYVANSNLPSAKTNPAWQGNGGILVNMMDEVAARHDPPLQPQLFKGFASKQARRFYPNSSFTACVMDVAVGRVDMCIGDFWLTTERLNMGASFLLPFGSDEFYLLAPKAKPKQLTFVEMLAKPWVRPSASHTAGT
jgi:hypothetical protein